MAKHQKPSRSIADKWQKHLVCLKDPKLSDHLPDTILYSADRLDEKLNQHQTLILKPCKGSLGKGLLKVSKNESVLSKRYTFYVKSKKKTYSHLNELKRGIHQQILNKPYLLQEAISLYGYNGRPIDFRVVAHRDPKSWNWTYIGICARIAGKNQWVTNVGSGGKVIPWNKLLDKNKADSILYKLQTICLNAAECMGNKYPGLTEIGADLALDKLGHPWIIELNTRPDAKAFIYLKDLKTYRKLMDMRSEATWVL